MGRTLTPAPTGLLAHHEAAERLAEGAGRSPPVAAPLAADRL